MIYVVVGVDWEDHRNIFATKSKELAETKLAELIEYQKRLVPAFEEFSNWIHENYYAEVNVSEWEANEAAYIAKQVEIEAKYNLRKDELDDNLHLSYSIEEVESD
jgi:hypothetical protein